MRFSLTFDLKHWLWGVNWVREKLPLPIWVLALHFGPWCLMWTRKE